VDELTLITVLVFVTAALGLEGIYWVASGSRNKNKSINRRLWLSRQLNARKPVLSALRKERRVINLNLNSAFFQRANDFLVQSGLRVGGRVLAVCFIVMTVFMFSLLGFIFGYNIETLVGASLVGAFAIFVYCKILRQKRLARFSALLPETVDVIVRGIRVGYPLPAALNLVAREMPDPIGTEFGIVADEIAFGQDIRTAIGNLYRRVGQDDLLLLIMAINIQSQTGGNLAEILTGLSRLLRSRSKIRMKIRALSADGRMSAIVLSVIPFVLFGGICLISPSYFGEIRHHPLVGPALAYAAISLIFGNIVMYRMVNFKF